MGAKHVKDFPMKRTRVLTYLWTLQWDLLVWLVALIVFAIKGGRLAWQDLGLWAVLPDPEDWQGSGWLGITLGHGGVLTAKAFGTRQDTTGTERHEGVHVEQYEAMALAGFVLGLIVFGVVALSGLPVTGALLGELVWLGAFPAVIGAGHIVAKVRGEDLYWGATHEEAARAISEKQSGC